MSNNFYRHKLFWIKYVHGRIRIAWKQCGENQKSLCKKYDFVTIFETNFWHFLFMFRIFISVSLMKFSFCAFINIQHTTVTQPAEGIMCSHCYKISLPFYWNLWTLTIGATYKRSLHKIETEVNQNTWQRTTFTITSQVVMK